MIAFWSIVAGLTAVTLAFLIMPLLRKPKSDAAMPGRADFDLTVYKDQLAELDRDLARGVLTDDQVQAARIEIERRMLSTDEPAEGIPTGASTALATERSKSAWAMIAVVVLGLPLGAVSFYLYLGEPLQRDLPLAQRAQENKGENEVRQRAMTLVTQMQTRLEENPKDIEGWLILGQVFEAMKRYDEAASAYEQAVNLTNRHPEPLTAWAEAMIMAEDTVIIPKVKEILQEIKIKDPSEPRSYFYLALERQQRDDPKGAMDEYVQLMKVTPEDAEWVEQIRGRMGQLAEQMGVDVPVVTLLPPVGPPTDQVAGDAGDGAVAPGPSPEQIEAAQNMTEEERLDLVRSMVGRLADRLKTDTNDLVGWQRLAQAYRILGETDKATAAEAEAKRIIDSGVDSGVASAPRGPSAQQVQDAQAMSEEDRKALIKTMVGRLADRLKENPDDLVGWQRIAQAYRVMGDLDKVAEAEAQVKRLQAR